MKSPFCENNKCPLNKIKVAPSIGRILIGSELEDKEEVLRHVYRKKGGNVPSEITQLCGVCHNAVQTVI